MSQGIGERLRVKGLVRCIGNIAIKLGKAAGERLTVVPGDIGDVFQHRFSSVNVGGTIVGTGSAGGVVATLRN